MNAFASYINGVKIDYHVIVLARSGSGTYDICIPPPLGGASCGNGPRFTQINQAVYSTDSLKKVQQYITSIESFMRPKSLRIFVEVSDDNSYITAAAFDSFLKARGGAYNDYIFHSIVGLTSGGCVAKVGDVYKQLSSWTKGMTFHICNANWNTLFNQLGQQVANIATTQYKLKHTPLISTMKVTYNGAAKQVGTHWVYDTTNQQLVLKGQLPGAGTQIKVCYQYIP
jgi:hypothetical protein